MKPKPLGFPKGVRLLKRFEFRRVYDEGVTPPVHNAGFHLFVYRKEGQALSHLGLTVTRATGNSVVRNRLRRWARETYRTTLAASVAPEYDLVLNFHRNLATRSRRDFDRLLTQVFEKAGLVKITN
ncbi:TPA: ribonuclease P protein component [Candidatus Sumerlaeota bacterium]|jgi:ribonuclease P protein component|nr:ribonuclease P protein component [Candidatus Sumerlaeota bacterium]